MSIPTININQNPACNFPAQPVRSSNPTNASTSMQGGEAVFQNDNYRITANDDNTVNIVDKKTGDTTKIWGDPHVDVNGKHAFDFWGKTTFSLKDGTKITIDTTPFKDNPKMTLASQVTITNGDYGVRISGVDSNTKGDLKVDEAAGFGQLLDAVTSDGNVLQQNPEGKGYLAVDSQGKIQKVDQTYIDKTDLTKTGRLEDKYATMMDTFKSLISIAFQGFFVGDRGSPINTTPVDAGSTPAEAQPVVGTSQSKGTRPEGGLGSDATRATVVGVNPVRVSVTSDYTVGNGASVTISIKPRVPLELTPEGLVRMEYKQESLAPPGSLATAVMTYGTDTQTIELPPGAKGFELRGQAFNFRDFR